MHRHDAFHYFYYTFVHDVFSFGWLDSSDSVRSADGAANVAHVQGSHSGQTSKPCIHSMPTGQSIALRNLQPDSCATRTLQTQSIYPQTLQNIAPAALGNSMKPSMKHGPTF